MLGNAKKNSVLLRAIGQTAMLVVFCRSLFPNTDSFYTRSCYPQDKGFTTDFNTYELFPPVELVRVFTSIGFTNITS